MLKFVLLTAAVALVSMAYERAAPGSPLRRSVGNARRVLPWVLGAVWLGLAGVTLADGFPLLAVGCVAIAVVCVLGGRSLFRRTVP